MDAIKRSSQAIFDELLQRYPQLSVCREDIKAAFEMLLKSYRNKGKLLIAGNGGSAADSDHISGELTKSFLFKRAVDPQVSEGLAQLFGEEGKTICDNLEGGLPAIPLPTMNASNSAFANDVGWRQSFAQLVNALGMEGDVFLGITTSGNSGNIVDALMVSKVKGVGTIALTGRDGGRCKTLADVCIVVPEKETFKIQELHLPVYHALCSMVEAELFEPRSH